MLPAFGQQVLWTTIKDSVVKYVPLDDVPDAVMEFYDYYELYFDGSGFSKEGFFKMYEGANSKTITSEWRELKKRILEINTPTVFAFKYNPGNGSIVIVMCISQENVNFVSFSNNYERGAQLITSSGKEKFTKWFKTLLE